MRQAALMPWSALRNGSLCGVRPRMRLLEQAILSAIADIESDPALNARVESVDSALVGLSDIAELTGLTCDRPSPY